MPKPDQKVVLIGGGGHAKVIIDAVRKSGKLEIYGILDPKLPKGSLISGVKVIGNDDMLPELSKKGIKSVFIALASTNSNGCSIRGEIYKKLKKMKFKFPKIVHPDAIIASDVIIGEGAFIAAAVVINPCVIIGNNVIINTKASVDHDCIIGDSVHIAPGVTLSGGVKVGDETHIGMGVSIIQCITIGKQCMVGAGTTIRHGMSDRSKNYGQYTAGPYEKE